MIKNLIKGVATLVLALLLASCKIGTSSNYKNSNNNEGSSSSSNNEQSTAKNEQPSYSYKGLQFYYKELSPDQYRLEQLSDEDFNALPKDKKLKVANNLLNSLFFGYPLKDLERRVNSGNFISNIRDSLTKNQINRDAIENHIRDEEYFTLYANNPWTQPQVTTILTRFYAMDKLDRYYFENWEAYILTQTIMFSPAYELTSTSTPDISRVYNRLVNMLDIDSGMRYITYVHMMSEDNWRRFRSPEDNGREMLEIFTLDANDSHVPLAGKALQNWKLNRDSDTLEVTLNKNHTPIKLFNTTLYTGEDFYRELVKSKEFTYGVTKRLVDFFFPNKSKSRKAIIIDKIVSSKPQKWEDILKQILFSKEYLLNNKRALSAEERFFSFTKKMNFKVAKREIYVFKVRLNEMHQAAMKYKLGKLNRVPLDTLSFAVYNKYIRERILLNWSYPDETNRDSWKYDGWGDLFINTDNFVLNEDNQEQSLKNYINYLFKSTIGRGAKEAEYKLFISHMMENGELKNEFNLVIRENSNEEKDRRERRINIARVILDYISRLEETYTQSEVE